MLGVKGQLWMVSWRTVQVISLLSCMNEWSLFALIYLKKLIFLVM